jgi:lactate dehydrogenase-like 2-hydroxyacid dehydrogenase
MLPEAAMSVLEGVGSVRLPDREPPLPVAELHELVRGAHGVVTLLHDRVDSTLLNAAGGQLRVIANVAVGYDNVDLAACAARGVVVTNTPGVLTDATADTAMALILMATRRMGEGERLIRAAQPWKWGLYFHLGVGLRGKTLGIVGLGQIGRATAHRARAFGMEIVYSARTRAPIEVEAALDAQHLSLDDLLTTADVVSLHCPLRPETRHLIGAPELARMKPTTFLINTARGPIVDEDALVTALREGTIAGAGLDVFEHEPEVNPGLFDLENAVLLPHLGSATVETRTAMAVLAAKNVAAMISGEPPLTAVI